MSIQPRLYGPETTACVCVCKTCAPFSLTPITQKTNQTSASFNSFLQFHLWSKMTLSLGARDEGQVSEPPVLWGPGTEASQGTTRLRVPSRGRETCYLAHHSWPPGYPRPLTSLKIPLTAGPTMPQQHQAWGPGNGSKAGAQVTAPLRPPQLSLKICNFKREIPEKPFKRVSMSSSIHLTWAVITMKVNYCP